MIEKEGPLQGQPVQMTEITIVESIIDHYGHINYTEYPKLLEPEQDEYMERRGIGFEEIERKFGLRSPVVKMDIEYNSELRVGDVARVYTMIDEIGMKSFTFAQTIEKDGKNVVNYKLKVVLTDKNGSVLIPEQIRQDLIRAV